MMCAWQEYLNLLPIWLRDSVDKQGRDSLQELRLRLNAPPELITARGIFQLTRKITADDLIFTINVASQYSPWATETVAKGYITAAGGHRIGLCGAATVISNQMSGIRIPTSLCLRVARDFPGIAKDAGDYKGSILVIGKPGSGKTTLLRDLIRVRSDKHRHCVAVVDEKGEIFPQMRRQFCFYTGERTDILSLCPKPQGIETVLRNMSPETIAVDEITAQEDCQALLHAGWCGVHLLATAHAGNLNDLYSRPVYKPIIASQIFDTVLVMHADKHWHAERMTK